MELSILGPVFLLVGWTYCVLVLIPIMRFTAAALGKVEQQDFKLSESSRVPGWVILPNRNYMNLLELPVLFYVLCLLLLLTHQQTEGMAYAAWGYVFLRILHSLIHLTFNQVILRMVVFASSNILLLLMWIVTGVRLLAVAQ
jgi:hypothetical protein